MEIVEQLLNHPALSFRLEESAAARAGGGNSYAASDSPEDGPSATMHVGTWSLDWLVRTGLMMAVGLVGPSRLDDVAAWVASAWAFIEELFILKMEIQAMIQVNTCVVTAAALWRSGQDC